MTAPRAVAQKATFVDGTGGARLRIVSQPERGEWLGTVIWVHAFAEEMNKTRRMSALMARLLSSGGWRVVQRDLYGCGDSAGDFADASWVAWLDDVDAELRQADTSRPVWLWCVRAGALLASPALVGRPDVNLLLWQPVTVGARHLQQFLRMSTGARVLGAAPEPARRAARRQPAPATATVPAPQRAVVAPTAQTRAVVAPSVQSRELGAGGSGTAAAAAAPVPPAEAPVLLIPPDTNPPAGPLRRPRAF